ncbi:MAG TPA: uroporphyrinogen decarboxylase family protein, partial [Negativicutes bacterium]
MRNLTPKERLLAVLRHEVVDRPPVICPGGMMNAAIVDVMNASGHTLPAAHSDATLMAGLAAAVHQHTGFENLGVPFCMTAEAEVFGSAIDLGTFTCEPKITKELFPFAAAVTVNDIEKLLQCGRIQTIADTVRLLSEKHPTIPVIGNLTGPISTAASIIDPIPFLKDLRKNPTASHHALEYVTDFLIAFAKLLIDNGADLISIADPTATGEILGPKMFDEYAIAYLNKLIDGIHAHTSPARRQTPVIVHICGNMNSVK